MTMILPQSKIICQKFQKHLKIPTVYSIMNLQKTENRKGNFNMFTKLGLQLYTLRDFFKDEEFTDLTFKKRLTPVIPKHTRPAVISNRQGSSSLPISMVSISSVRIMIMARS